MTYWQEVKRVIIKTETRGENGNIRQLNGQPDFYHFC